MEIKKNNSFIDMTGKIFGQLTVIDIAYKSKNNGDYYWNCVCSCGVNKVIWGTAMRRSRRPTKSCGCLQKAFQKSRTGVPNKKRLSFEEYAIRGIFSHAKKHARSRNLTFELSKEDVANLALKNCYYCDLEPSNRMKHPRPNLRDDVLYSGIDRLNNSLGYVAGNVVSCCKRCNLAKHTMKQEDFFNWIKKVYLHLIKTQAMTENDND